jgi:DNA-binding MarR family transcriptional regulator
MNNKTQARAAVSRKDVSLAVARLIPYIMRGTQLDFFLKRGVTQTQFLVLNAIRASTRCSMTTLARDLHVTPPTVSGIVDRLVRAGFLRRQPLAGDRRQVLVELAPKADAFFRDFESVIRERWEEALISLESDELDAFHHAVTKIRDGLST